MSRANHLNGSEWLKNSFSIWRGLGKDRDSKKHPAPFPIALASRVIECYAANPDGLVLDPFAGSGSTLLAALRAGMGTVGFDINSEYRKIFEQRLLLSEINCDRWCYQVQDARTMGEIVSPGSVEICITSPPYWDILNRKRSAYKKDAQSYSNDANDIGNITDYVDFLSALGEIATHIDIALRHGGYFVLNVMDIRKGPNFYPLHSDAILMVQDQSSFSLEDVIVWDRQSDYNSMRPLGYPHKFIINKVHEYLLVFRKP